MATVATGKDKGEKINLRTKVDFVVSKKGAELGGNKTNDWKEGDTVKVAPKLAAEFEKRGYGKIKA